MTDSLEDQAVEKFREYLRIDTTTKHADYDSVVKFLARYADELKCKFQVVEMVAGKPVCLLIFPGTTLANETIMLNSHSDVVPADAGNWSHPPFAAEIDEHGRIFGRGSNDTKQIGIQYLEAIRKLRQENIAFKRTVAVTFVPDEEIGGFDGMRKFVESKEFQSMNVVYCLDEGVASPSTEVINFSDIEKYKMPFLFTINGAAGHSSLLNTNTAAEKLARLLDEIYNFREEQRKKIGTVIDGKVVETTGVISMNATIISGGIGENVLPDQIKCVVDCRVPPNVLPNDFHKMIGELVRRASMRTSAGVDESKSGDDLLAGCGGIHIESLRAAEFSSVNPQLLLKDLSRKSQFSAYLENGCKLFGKEYKWHDLVGQTDGRYLRRLGIPTVNVSPLYGVPILAHVVDEHIHRDLFIDGIKFYYYVIQELANSG